MKISFCQNEISGDVCVVARDDNGIIQAVETISENPARGNYMGGYSEMFVNTRGVLQDICGKSVHGNCDCSSVCSHCGMGLTNISKKAFMDQIVFHDAELEKQFA
jgi:hypothetical protein